MIQYFYKNRKKSELLSLSEYKAGCWICIENPTEKELIDLSEQLNLETDLLLDALDPFEVPRIEKEDKETYIFSRFAHKDGKKISTSPVLNVISSDFLMTISVKQLPFLSKFTNSKIDFYTTQKTKLLMLLFTQMQKDYQSLVNTIHRNIRNISSDLEQIDNKDINTFVKFETLFNDFLFGLEPTSLALKKLASGKYINYMKKIQI